MASLNNFNLYSKKLLKRRCTIYNFFQNIMILDWATMNFKSHFS